jgi:CRISPR/Cas system CSM-associated protein Csm2 small subunit
MIPVMIMIKKTINKMNDDDRNDNYHEKLTNIMNIVVAERMLLRARKV